MAKKSRRRSKVRIKISHKGTMMGYKVANSMAKRHASLTKVVRKYGYGPAMKKLNALAVFNKHNSSSRIYNKDKRW